MGVLHSKQQDSWEDPLDFGSIVPPDHSITTSRDYDIKLVKRFIREGRLAPFYQAGYYEKPTSHSNSQIDLPTTHSLLQAAPSLRKQDNMLAMATHRISLFLASHIPESVQHHVLYQDTTECPICFLLKRSVDSSSLAIHCPFCMQSHLGVIRVPPPWSLHYASFCKRRSDFLQNQETGKRKRLYIYDPDVVLVDHVRPDWQENLGSSSSGSTSSNGSTRRAVVRPTPIVA
ncbi:hypothetical protein [Absidia glauca]|uniref:Uncharacterized protein n=1 Tax=Absidia glauca TaxID=4829 RepID=A0A168MAP8_ABSGL|nr:hypothetical protein [Absidia glauca]